ncbi:MAG: hypothetical protein SNJ72_05490 [Fimbriimonadales bacterium]
MYKILDAVLSLQADNPLGLPVIRSVRQTVPIKGTSIRSGVFFVITEREVLDFGRRLAAHPRLRFLEKVRYNVLAANFLYPPTKEPGTLPYPDRAELTLYDYTNNIGYLVTAHFPTARWVEVTPMKEQPLYFSEVEYRDAVQILTRDPNFGEPLRRGTAFCSPGMPAVVHEAAPDSPLGRLDVMPSYVPSHRCTVVQVHYGRGSGLDGRTALFMIDLVDQTVVGYTNTVGDFAPAACGGPPSGSSCGSVGGSTWQALSWGPWSMMVRRPAGTRTSEQNSGAGVELRDVFYNGRLVIRRAGMPVLNVFYDGNSCGPYRDWLYSENCFKCTGTDIGNGLRVADPNTNVRTICEDMNDAGTLRGVAVYEDAGELVLISECDAGWYRYITGWRFHPSGIIRPRFMYGYTDSSCVCRGRLHNAIWRIHFALDGQGGLMVEEYDAPRGSRAGRWTPIVMEARRLRYPDRDRRWRVRKLSTGFTAEIVPGAKDGLHEAFTTGEGDVWVMRYKPGSGGLDAEVSGSGGSWANISQYVNGEKTVDQDLVVWYGAHLRKRGADTFECPPLGPDIILSG